jgi:phosphatidyl-myo-inositol dimannoside synthase
MHDLLFAYEFPPMVGGIARWMAALARLSPPGTLTVSTGTLPGAHEVDAQLPNPVDRVAVHSERLRTVQGLVRWAGRGARLASEPSARFAWCDTVRPAGYVAHHAWWRCGLPYGIIIHGNDVLTLRRKVRRSTLKRRIMRRVLAAAAVYVANSHWTAAECRALLHELGLEEAEDGVQVVPLGTDPLHWRPDAVAAEAFRRRRQLPAGRWLLTVARLVPYKGIDTAVRVLATLVPSHPDLYYAVIGRGPQQYALRVLADELGVGHRVHLLTDVADDELPGALSLADVYVGLSRQTPVDIEGFGLSFLEASATGRPVVAGASGGIPDAVVDGETGLLVDPVDVGEAAEAVRRLLADPDLARRMGRAGRERVLQQFTWQRVIDDLRTIAADRGRGAPVGA